MENGSIRLARLSEYQAVAAIKVDASRLMGADYVTRPLPQDVFDHYVPLGGVWVAVDAGDQPVGYALAYDYGDDFYLRHLFVRMEQGRQGLGGQLLRVVLAEGDRRHRRAVTLTTGGTVPWNAPFYSRYGFVVLDKTMPAYLREMLDVEIAHFAPDAFPWILQHPEHLPRVAMERILL